MTYAVPRQSQLKRQEHLNLIAERMGIDGLALCGNEADLGLFDEMKLDGLMNEPWYERLTGTEFSLFKKKTMFKVVQQHKQKKPSTPAFLHASVNKALTADIDILSSADDDLGKMTEGKYNIGKRLRRKRFGSVGNPTSSDDEKLSGAGPICFHNCKVPLANKDLLKNFQDHFLQDSNSLVDAVDSLQNTTNCLDIKGHLDEAFRQAQADMRANERPLRSLVRFSFTMLTSLLGLL